MKLVESINCVLIPKNNDLVLKKERKGFIYGWRIKRGKMGINNIIFEVSENTTWWRLCHRVGGGDFFYVKMKIMFFDRPTTRNGYTTT